MGFIPQNGWGLPGLPINEQAHGKKREATGDIIKIYTCTDTIKHVVNHLDMDE
jgi:hypothetical protein